MVYQSALDVHFKKTFQCILKFISTYKSTHNPFAKLPVGEESAMLTKHNLLLIFKQISVFKRAFISLNLSTFARY